MRKYYHDVNIRNAEHFGYENQREQLEEECCELIMATKKYRRTQGHGKTPKMSEAEAFRNIIEEIADVEVMLEQIKHLLNIKQEEIDCIKIAKIMGTRMSYVGEGKNNENTSRNSKNTKPANNRK